MARTRTAGSRIAFHALFGFAAVLAADAGAATFAGQNLGAIPDNNAVGRDVAFPVSGLDGHVSNVQLSITLSHEYVGDLEARLISPAGVAQLVVFGRVGYRASSSSGTAANLTGTYVFRDTAPGDLWQTAALDVPIPAGAYRATTAGKPGISDIGGCSTHMNLAFGGLQGSLLNGQWTLRLTDRASPDAGTVTAAALTIDTQTVLFAGGFENEEPSFGSPEPSTTRGRCREVLFDYTGTGVTSYTTVRNTGGGSGGAITWTIRENDGTTAGPITSFVLGINTNSFTDGDYDGDGIRDAAVYDAAPGRLTVRRSSRPGDVPLVIQLGATSDDPTISGDYDGDNVTDFAVYRAGATAGDPSSTIIRSSRSGQVRTVTTGQNGHFPASGVDYTGDGIADMLMQSNGGGGNGRFILFDGVNGNQLNDFIFGSPTDVIVLGSHAGSPVADVTLIRGGGGQITWLTRDGATGIASDPVILGASATDFPLSGDFDGDGLYDQAVWRPSATVDASKFIVRRSSNPGLLLEVPQGLNGDYPVANGRTH